jgi:hypothetical protein
MNRWFELVIIIGLSYYLFCSIITVVYLTNIGNLALPWAPAAFGALFCASALLGLAVYKTPAAIRYGFIAVGSYVLIRDIITPFPSVTIDDGSRRVTFANFELIKGLSAGLVALILTWTLARFVTFRKFVAIFFAVFLAVDVATHVVGLSSTDHARDESAAKGLTADASNVYHLVFDGFSGPLFAQTADQLNVLEEFQGFTLFNKAKANHYPTYASMASIMLSEYYSDADEPYYDWLTSWKDPDAEDSLFKRMIDNGYALHQYTDIPANSAATPSQTKLTGNVTSRVNLILAIYAARLSPVVLRQKAMDTVSEYLSFIQHGVQASSFLDYRAWDSPLVFSTMVADENARPNKGQYVFYHGFNPHGPFPLQLDCTPAKAQSNFNAMGCSINSMLEMIRELKESGKYDDALIIIHSDHGNESNAPNVGGEYFDQEFSKAFNQYFWYPESRTGGEIKNLRLTAPLLLVKLPKSKEPFRIDERELAELADIGPTIFAATGLAIATKRGAALNSEEHDLKQEISVFPEVLSWRGNRLEDGLRKRKPDSEWRLPHLIYRPGDTWELRPAVPWQ